MVVHVVATVVFFLRQLWLIVTVVNIETIVSASNIYHFMFSLVIENFFGVLICVILGLIAYSNSDNNTILDMTRCDHFSDQQSIRM